MPLLLVDNLFSPVLYPDVVLSANEEATGREAEFFATLRREDHWSPTSFNAIANLKARHTQPRGFNMVALFVHNLLGEAYQFQISDDDFTSIQTVIDVTIPSEPGAGHVDDANGVVTDDFLWLKRVPTRYAHDFRHNIPAMGADLKPELSGIVGMAFSFDRDRGDLVDVNDMRGEEHRSDRGVVGRGTMDIARNGSMPIKFTTLFEYEAARFHLLRYDGTVTGHPIPALLVFDESRAEQALMVHRPLGRHGFRQEPGYFYPAGEIAYAEHDPREV